MTFQQFCQQHGVTAAERQQLAVHLATLRMAQLLEALFRGY
jgi:hypothetical protein